MKNLPEAIGWTLLHFTWQATVIAAVCKCFDQGLQQSRTILRYNVTLAALVCMFGTSIATLVYEQERVNHVQRSGTASATMPASVQISSLHEHLADALRVPFHLNTIHLFQWIDGVWLVGVLLCSIRAAGGVLVLRRMRSALSVEPIEEMAELFRGLVGRMRINRQVSLRMHIAGLDPFVAGLFRSIVYLPLSALSSLTPDQIEAVLTHELAHVRRADCIGNLLNTSMETLFFFHPAVWWLGRTLREQREFCCDDIVLVSCSSPMNYAQALLVLAENQQISPHLALSAGGHGGRHLFFRIERILGNEPSTERQSEASVVFNLAIPAIMLVVAGCLFLAAPAGNHFPGVQAAAISASRIRFYQHPARSTVRLASVTRSNLERFPTKRITIHLSQSAAKETQSERSLTELAAPTDIGDYSERRLRIHNHQHHDHQHSHHHTHAPGDSQSTDG